MYLTCTSTTLRQIRVAGVTSTRDSQPGWRDCRDEVARCRHRSPWRKERLPPWGQCSSGWWWRCSLHLNATSGSWQERRRRRGSRRIQHIRERYRLFSVRDLIVINVPSDSGFFVWRHPLYSPRHPLWYQRLTGRWQRSTTDRWKNQSSSSNKGFRRSWSSVEDWKPCRLVI